MFCINHCSCPCFICCSHVQCINCALEWRWQWYSSVHLSCACTCSTLVSTTFVSCNNNQPHYQLGFCVSCLGGSVLDLELLTSQHNSVVWWHDAVWLNNIPPTHDQALSTNLYAHLAVLTPHIQVMHKSNRFSIQDLSNIFPDYFFFLNQKCIWSVNCNVLVNIWVHQ